MPDLESIQTILEIHGESLHSDPVVIRTILESAAYPETEILYVLTLVPKPVDPKTSRQDGLYKLFRADTSLRPSEVSALLGVSMRVTDLPKVIPAKPKASYKETMVVCSVTVLLAVFGLVAAMYAAEIGPFHKTVVASYAD